MRQQIIILKFFLITITGLAVLLPLNVFSQDEHPQSRVEAVTTTSSDLSLTRRSEDMLIINNKRYTYNDKTIFLKHQQTISINQITFPCRVKITFKEFKAVNEANPFKIGQRLLTRVNIY